MNQSQKSYSLKNQDITLSVSGPVELTAKRKPWKLVIKKDSLKTENKLVNISIWKRSVKCKAFKDISCRFHVFYKKNTVYWQILQNSQEKTYLGLSFVMKL